MGDDNCKSPGAAALRNMKVLKSESSIFKVPKPPAKKSKNSKILDEEEYVEGIAKIIQRDFFPDLEKLKAQNEFLEATENKDYARLRQITRKYSGTRPPTEPYASPATFDTPGIDRPKSPSDIDIRTDKSHSSSSGNTANNKERIIGNHSLDSFLANHTSEDNASYERVINLEHKKRTAKVADQLEAEQKSLELYNAALALPSIEQQANQEDRPEELDTWRYKARNYIMYVPDGGGSQKPPPKAELQHQNTRLLGDPFDHTKNQLTINAIAETQNATVTGKIGIDGLCVNADKRRGTEYSFVATPSPRPGIGPDQSPLMTWGEIEGTPFRLDGGDTPLPGVGAGAAYHMLETGARERIALKLAEQVAKRRRPTTPHTRPLTPSFRTNTERLASMSPAARKLAAKHLLSPKLKLTSGYMGIASLSTTPKHTPKSRPIVSTPSLEKRPATPSKCGNTNNSTNLEENHLTDNLLQINVAKRTRLKAQDFFK